MARIEGVITARQQKNLSAAKSYFQEHLGQGDYYSEGNTVRGVWIGEGAVRLGLTTGEKVDELAYMRLCENCHPQTGEKLTVRKRIKDRRVFCDFPPSAPKSVSVMGITLGDIRIVQAHQEAAAVAFKELEALVATRVRQGGSKESRLTGNLVGATFLHTTSRALDPQLHTHFIVFNATYDHVEKRWKAMETQKIFESMTYLTEVYRSELASRLVGMGYRLRKGEHGFEIDGVSAEIVKRFSKRAAEIRESVAKLETELQRPLSNNERATVSYRVRGRKRRGITTAEVLKLQRSQLSAQELSALEALKMSSTREKPSKTIRRVFHPWSDASRAKSAIDFARDHLFERKSVVCERELFQVALKQGRVTLKELREELASRSEFLRKGDWLTTKAVLELEKEMIRLVDSGVGRFNGLAPAYEPVLDEKKANAVKQVLAIRDQVIALDGLAGTGKTSVLLEIAKAFENQKSVFAPTAAAVEVLRALGFSEATTIQSFLVQEHHSLKGQLLIVDEAGMLSNQQMVEILKIVREQGCRLLLVGDYRQHASVEAGDALRILMKHSQLAQVRLGAIERQTSLKYRLAVKDIALGRIDEGLHRLEKLGAIHQVDSEDRAERIAIDYLNSVKAGDSTLIVCPTWNEVDEVTQAVRTELKADGILPKDSVSIDVHRSLHWTLAQKRDLSSYMRGMVLTFHSPTRDFGRNEWATVTAVEEHRVELRKSDGKKAWITAKQSKAFDVAKVVPLELTEGDQILLMESRKGLGLYNGKSLTVKRVTEGGKIQTKEGITLPSDYRKLCHGYAVTSQRSQARSVDRVLVSMLNEAKLATNRKQFYVGISRGRKSVAIYAENRGLLSEAGQRKSLRTAAIKIGMG